MNHIFWALGVEQGNESGAALKRLKQAFTTDWYHFGSDSNKSWQDAHWFYQAQWIWLWIPALASLLLELAANLPREFVLLLNTSLDALKNYLLKQAPYSAIVVYPIWLVIKSALMAAQLAAEFLAKLIHTFTRPLEALEQFRALFFWEKNNKTRGISLFLWAFISTACAIFIYLTQGSAFITTLAEVLAGIGLVVTVAATWEILITIALITFLPSFFGQLIKAFNEFSVGFPHLKSLFRTWVNNIFGSFNSNTSAAPTITSTPTTSLELDDTKIIRPCPDLFSELQRHNFEAAYEILLMLFKPIKINTTAYSPLTWDETKFNDLLDLAIEITGLLRNNSQQAAKICFTYLSSFDHIVFLASNLGYNPTKAKQLEDNLKAIYLPQDNASLSLSPIDTHAIQLDKKIGEGTFGRIYRGQYNNQAIAVKFMFLAESGNIFQAKREYHTLTYLNQKLNEQDKSGQYVIGVHGFSNNFQSWSQMVIFLELADKSLHDVIHSKRTLTSQQVKDYMLQMIAGLMFIHQVGMLHRDIKPMNMLLSNGQVKYCDFGPAVFKSQLAVPDSDQSHITVTTENYASASTMRLHVTPTQFDQYVNQQQLGEEFKSYPPYSEESDTYSLGLSMIELITGEMPYYQKNVCFEFLSGAQPFTNPESAIIATGLPPDLAKTILNTWLRNPKKRTTLATLYTEISKYQPTI